MATLDPTYAVQLHDSGEKPFSLSLICERKTCAGEPPATYGLRIASLEEKLSSLLLRLDPNRIRSLRLARVEFEVVGIAREKGEHPWAGYSTYQELYNNGIARARKPGSRMIGLRFASPTAFRLVGSRLNMPLPWPRLVFQSLAQRWNAFSPIPIWVNWPEFDRSVTVGRCRGLDTAMLDFGHYKQVGFVGDCWFHIDKDARISTVQALNTLADFAFFSGVGRKTAMGMGLVCRIEEGGMGHDGTDVGELRGV